MSVTLCVNQNFDGFYFITERRIMDKKKFCRSIIYRSALKTKLDEIGYFPNFQDLRDQDENLQVELLDRDLKDIYKLTPEEIRIVRGQVNNFKDNYQDQEDVRKYPLLSINRINCSPNVQSKGWIFTGSQAGLGRFLLIPQLAKIY